MISQTISRTVTNIDFQTQNAPGLWTWAGWQSRASYCTELTQLNSHNEIKMSTLGDWVVTIYLLQHAQLIAFHSWLKKLYKLCFWKAIKCVDYKVILQGIFNTTKKTLWPEFLISPKFTIYISFF